METLARKITKNLQLYIQDIPENFVLQPVDKQLHQVNGSRTNRNKLRCATGSPKLQNFYAWHFYA